MWVYAIGHLSDNHLSCYITYHLLTCSIWSYTVTSPCPDSHGWCPTMRKLPEDKWCFMMLPHSVSTLSMCCGVSLWLNVLINTWCCVIIHVFDGQLGIYLIYAILCLCHLLDNHVKWYTILNHLPDGCVWWYSMCYIHDGLIMMLQCICPIGWWPHMLLHWYVPSFYSP